MGGRFQWRFEQVPEGSGAWRLRRRLRRLRESSGRVPERSGGFRKVPGRRGSGKASGRVPEGSGKGSGRVTPGAGGGSVTGFREVPERSAGSGRFWERLRFEVGSGSGLVPGRFGEVLGGLGFWWPGGSGRWVPRFWARVWGGSGVGSGWVLYDWHSSLLASGLGAHLCFVCPTMSSFKCSS